MPPRRGWRFFWREFYKDFAPAGAGPQPRCGWEFFADDRPRVARVSQPWALGRNPVGILGQRNSMFDAQAAG